MDSYRQRNRLSALIDKHPTLARFFRHKVGWQDAEDLVQEAYFRILRLDRNHQSEIENPEAYLFAIARNLLAERAKLLQRRGLSFCFEELSEEPIKPELAGDERLDQEFRNAKIAGVIETLKPRLRAVMIMRYREGMSYKEMAAHLQVSTHAIKKYLSEALHICRRAMKQHGYG